jgi:RNA polymerase sigma-70 factor (ECF subfamily)
MSTGTLTPEEDSLDARRAADRATWLEPLAGTGPAHEAAVRELHAVLVRAAAHEVHRRRAAMGLELGDAQDLIEQAAGDALVAELRQLDTFEGRSRFTTWAYKVAVHIAGVAVRRAAWERRAVPSPDDALERICASVRDPQSQVGERELLRATLDAIGRLTPRQRDVLVSLAIDGVPIDVLAERLATNRGALYKALHDARQAVRRQLHAEGFLDDARSEVLDD